MTKHASLQVKKPTPQVATPIEPKIIEVEMKPQTMQIHLDLSELNNKLRLLEQADIDTATFLAALSSSINAVNTKLDSLQQTDQLKREVLALLKAELQRY